MEIERVICAVNSRTPEEEEKMKDKETRLMWSDGISRPIPRIKRYVQVKIARRIHAAYQKKKTLDGLYDVLGSTVGKITPAISVRKERNKPGERVGNSLLRYLRP